MCLRCTRRLSRAQYGCRLFQHSAGLRQVDVAKGDGISRSFFWANAIRKHPQAQEKEEAICKEGSLLDKSETLATIGALQEPPSKALPIAAEPPHRRRKRLKAEAAARALSDAPLPPDASSALSRAAEAAPVKSARRTISTYLALTKPRLAFLVVLTSTATYSIYPVPALLSTMATDAPSLSALTLLFLTSGTFFQIASANTLNMLFEPEYDAKMSRTRNRPLVRGLVTKRAALIFAIATALLGTGLLWEGVNPTTAILGASNIVLYAFVYTPLKRVHPVNTWIGALVGAIPPLMGWCAAASQYSVTNGSWNDPKTILDEMKELLFTKQSIGGWLIAALLFAWQFPHFFALSSKVRQEYADAGYKMLTSSNTAMAARVSLRYSLAMFAICAGLSYCHVTDPSFLVTSSVINGWMAKEAFRFWRYNAENGSARALFWASVWQLPIVLVLAMLHKEGLWERLWRGIMGEPEPDDDWYESDI